MSANGHSSGDVLCWPRKLLSADDLRFHLNGQRELQLLPRTIITPLAADELRARGIRVTYQLSTPAAPKTQGAGAWGVAEERPDGAVQAAVQALGREGITLRPLPTLQGSVGAWARQAAEQVAAEQVAGGIVFCGDPCLVCCVANKMAGLRAAPVLTVSQAARARKAFGANLLAVEMPGRTFFEVRQILRAVALPGVCPDELALTLKELDGHAHR